MILLFVRCLQCYKGETLIYVGEGQTNQAQRNHWHTAEKTTNVTKAMTILGSGRGGVNGDNTFFDLLAEKWKLEDTLSLDTLPWPKP